VSLRPCPPGGLAPYQDALLVGKRLVRAVPAGDVVRLDDVKA
jgi:hypothetical protein